MKKVILLLGAALASCGDQPIKFNSIARAVVAGDTVIVRDVAGTFRHFKAAGDSVRVLPTEYKFIYQVDTTGAGVPAVIVGRVKYVSNI